GLAPLETAQSENWFIATSLAGTYAPLTDSAFGGWDLIPVECSRLRRERTKRREEKEQIRREKENEIQSGGSEDLCFGH
ncbi:hypothetical protein KI387_041577, partial [Taxus chinensis]